MHCVLHTGEVSTECSSEHARLAYVLVQHSTPLPCNPDLQPTHVRNRPSQFDDARDAVLGEKAAQMRARKRAAQGARRIPPLPCCVRHERLWSRRRPGKPVLNSGLCPGGACGALSLHARVRKAL